MRGGRGSRTHNFVTKTFKTVITVTDWGGKKKPGQRNLGVLLTTHNTKKKHATLCWAQGSVGETLQ